MAKIQCQSNNSKGERCKAFANVNGFCFMHDTEKGKERAIARRNGGLATKKPHNADTTLLPSSFPNIASVMLILDYTLQETIVLDNSVSRGRLLVAIAHGYIEALKVGELEQRLEAIELAMKLRNKKK